MVKLILRGYDKYDSSLLRIVRVLRVVRVVRVLRVMSLAKDLQLLVICIMHSFSNFIWSIALLFLIIYIASIYLTQVTLTRSLDGTIPSADAKIFVDLYGTLPTTMMSLWQGLLGGLDWRELVEPLSEHISPVVSFILVIFILFTLLAVLNVITGNFVQTSLEEANEVKQVYRFSQARKMFGALDLDSSGTISYDEVSEHLEDPAVQDFFISLDVDISDARPLFDLIDLDGSGIIDFDEFLSGCMRLQSPARTTDLLLVARGFKDAFDQQWRAFTVLEASLQDIRRSLSLISAHAEEAVDV